MDSFCGSTFWNSSQSWETDTPDLTPCFQDTVLVYLPIIYLFLVSPYEVYKIRRESLKQTTRVPITLISALKIGLALTLTFVSGIEVAKASYALISAENVAPVKYVTPIIKMVAFSCVTILMNLNRKRAISSSGTIFIFWFLMTIGSIVTYRSIWMYLLQEENMAWDMDNIDFFLRVIAHPIIVIQVILSLFTDSLPPEYIRPNEQVIVKPSPEWTASFLSLLSFYWVNPIVVTGFKRPLKQEDLYDLDSDRTAASALKRLKKYMKDGTKTGITISLFKAFAPSILFTASFKFASVCLMFVAPITLDALLVWMQTRTPMWHGFFFCGIIFASAFIQSILDNTYEYNLNITAVRMRSAIINAVYQKALKLSPQAKTTFNAGQIVNYMLDAQKIMEFMMFFNYIWVAPLQISISIYLLWQQLGPSTMAGVTIMIVLIPLNGYITTVWRKSQSDLMKRKDERSKLFNELMSAIKVLKMYGWEPSFKTKIMKARKGEEDNLRKQSYFMALIVFTLSSAPIFVALTTFITFSLAGGELNPSRAFVSLTLFSLLRLPLTFLPLVITFGTIFVVSMKRVNKFLECDEFDETMVNKKSTTKDGNAIEMKDATFSWTNNFGDHAIKDINIFVPKGKLFAIVGRVGSGKSSVLSALLQDMYKVTGEVNIDGTTALVPQQAWIQNATLRDNIVFVSPFDQNKYDTIIKASALLPDIKILAGGDQTEIGEKGINLSGGQKQRINLARAVYADSDIYLMDDPLSAVDSHVGKHIFEQLIGPKGILKDKTRLLVTNKISILPQVDRIIVMKDGKINESGSYQELMENEGEFHDFLIEYLADVAEDENEEEEEVIAAIKAKVAPKLERAISKRESLTPSVNEQDNNKSPFFKSPELNRTISTSSNRKGSKGEQSVSSGSSSAKSPPETKPPARPPTGQLIAAETEETGGVAMTVYMEYFKAAGLWSGFLVLLVTVISSSFNIASAVWLSVWSDDTLYPERANDTSLRSLRMGVYGGLGFAESVFTLIGNLVTFLATLQASTTLHNMMLDRIMAAPTSFYDTTPLGRIVNRFTKDIDNLDTGIRLNLRHLLNSLFRTLTSLILISFQSPWFLAVVLPMIIVYYFIQKYYIASSRQLKRIESTTRSPIYSHFGETISGSSFIRSAGVSHVFLAENERLIDNNAKSAILSSAAARWLGIRLEFLGNLLVLTSALLAVTAIGSSDPAIAGLSISYSLTMTQVLNMLVNGSVNLENNLVSAERCIEYTKTPMEAAWYNEATKPAKSWPAKGVVQFDNYSVRYREGLDLVLNGVSFETKPNEKVGIVGRTGAGKSSLTLSLFRLIEPASGTIFIDGIDITTIGLQDLRNSLTIIPQDPVLFTGTMRLNLDPFNSYSDTAIWEALEMSHLKEFVSQAEGGLDFKVTEGGDNLSVGQRQLVCLGRALLRKSKILILDEATAAVDLETDDLIQQTIRTEFAECTILTIAHRLNTILDYDRVLVMADGKVAEFESPAVLLKDESSQFYSMAKAAGLVTKSGDEDEEDKKSQ